MIMLSGMHMKFEHLMHVGKRAAAVAVVGTLLPIAVGVAALFAVGVDPFPDGLAAGVTLAPTSVGIAIKLLTERKVLKADYGQVGASAGRAGARWWCIVRVFLVMVVVLAAGAPAELTAARSSGYSRCGLHRRPPVAAGAGHPGEPSQREHRRAARGAARRT